jgi:hypothetical protein
MLTLRLKISFKYHAILCSCNQELIEDSAYTSAKRAAKTFCGMAKWLRMHAERISSWGHIWPSSKFCSWLMSQGFGNLWESHVLPQMKNIASSTLVCCQPHVRPRSGSGQIYGYDFLVDASFAVWLLEINSSPTMEYSTQVTAEMCAQVQEDTLKVCMDNDTLHMAYHDSCRLALMCTQMTVQSELAFTQQHTRSLKSD